MDQLLDFLFDESEFLPESRVCEGSCRWEDCLERGEVAGVEEYGELVRLLEFHLDASHGNECR